MPEILYDTLRLQPFPERESAAPWVTGDGPLYAGRQLSGVIVMKADSAKADGFVNAREIFGQQSRPGEALTGTVAYVKGYEELNPFSSNPVYQVSMLVVSVCYILLICFFRSSATALLRVVRSKIYTAKLLDEANFNFTLSVRLFFMLSVLVYAIAIVRMVEIFAPGQRFESFPQWVFPTAIPLAVICLCGVRFYRHAIIRMAGWLTVSDEICTRILAVRNLSTAIGILFVAPILMLLALNTGPTRMVFAVMMGATILVANVLIVYKTYTLFEEQKVSNLLWFSYLCAVEIFPVSVIVALVTRSV